MTGDREASGPAAPLEPADDAIEPADAPERIGDVPISVESAPPEVALAESAGELPGAHRGGFTRAPTAPLRLAEPPAPAEPAPAEPAAPWRPTVNTAPVRTESGSLASGGYAMVFACLGLAASLVVGWTFPVGLLALILGIAAVRRRRQRGLAAWAIALAALSLAYSAGWLIFAFSRF